MNLPFREIDSDKGEFFSVETESGEFRFGFGNRYFSADDLRVEYPASTISRLKQVHGIDILPAAAEIQEADGHWTSAERRVLTVHTADCLPVLLFNIKSGTTMALHAGWRGLFAGIVQRALVMPQLHPLNECYLFAGAHIQPESFEVREDIFHFIHEGLQRTPALNFASIVAPRKNGRYSVDLAKFLKAEARAQNLPAENVRISAIDTFTSEHHFSYRRKNPTGRLISYIQRIC